jgi:hypothetical protein
MSSGNFLLQNAGTYTDNGYKVQIQPSGSASGSLFVSGSSVFSGSTVVSGSLTVNGDTTVNGTIFPSGMNQVRQFNSNPNFLGGTLSVGKQTVATTGYALDLSGSLLVTGSVVSTLGFTGSLLGTATTASFVTTAQTASYVFQAVSASYALTASYVSGSSNSAVSASYALSSSYAATASFANSFPDQGFNFTQAVGTTTWTVNHNLNTSTPLVNVYDSGYNQLIPAGVTSTTANTTQITFSTAQTGYAIISKGSGISSQTAVSSSFATTASYASSVGVNFVQSSPSTTWTINHNLNNRYPLVQTYGSDSLVLIPQSISGSSVNTTIITFSTAISGYARVI